MSEPKTTPLLQNALQNSGAGPEGKTSTKMQLSALGVFGGASVAIQNRILPALDWLPLTYSDGSAFTITAPVPDEIIEGLVRRGDIRAVLTGGDGTTDVTVIIAEVEA